MSELCCFAGHANITLVAALFVVLLARVIDHE